ncbi:MAG: ParB/RepB/Spo0J family partition protein [Coriobacteriales bacterium]|jgi:ParB family chromosome partitioning protein|nr:ParB/RepB/Spo0J family partition protein [Coriobacteriales bacterium]
MEDSVPESWQLLERKPLSNTHKQRNDTQGERVREILLDEIDPFSENPFQVRMDNSMRELAESVCERGVIVPVMVRPMDSGRYEMVSGHRRKYAAELAGLVTLPALVRPMERDEAIILLVDSNFHRSEILPSEKAYAYRLKYDVLKRQGNRTDLTSRPLGAKLPTRADKTLAQTVGDSARQVQRYIRLTELVPGLLELVDAGSMAMRPAVELSYLQKDEQENLLDAMDYVVCTPSHAQAIRLRRLSEEGGLSEDIMTSLLQEEKPNQREVIRMPRERLSRYFAPGTSVEVMEKTIITALELLCRTRTLNRGGGRAL